MPNRKLAIVLALCSAVAVTAFFYWQYILHRADSNMLSGMGQILAAWANSVSVIFLVLGYWISRQSVEFQMEELAMQREALQQTASAVNAQLLITTASQGRRTLDRYARSLSALMNNGVPVARGEGTTTHIDAMLEIPDLQVQLATKLQNKVFRAVADDYCLLYQALERLASSGSVKVKNGGSEIAGASLFELIEANSSERQLYSTLKPALARLST